MKAAPVSLATAFRTLSSQSMLDPPSVFPVMVMMTIHYGSDSPGKFLEATIQNNTHQGRPMNVLTLQHDKILDLQSRITIITRG